jgi:hypothetical protein
MGSVRIEIDSPGDVNALGFSLSFDSGSIRFVSATVGAGAPGASLNVNSAQADAGRIGIAIGLPTGQTISAGTQPIVELNFTAQTEALGTAALTFGDQPIVREAVNSNAEDLAVTYVDGAVTISPPVKTDPMADWMARHFSAAQLADPAISGDNADPDHDGTTNREEFLAGTDPLDAQSVLRANVSLAPVVMWNSVPNVTYRVLRSPSLSPATWTPLSPRVTATNSISVFTDLEAAGQAFYRIEVVP